MTQDIYSSTEAAEIFKKADKEKAHSFLLEGAEGAGKRDIALNFASGLLGNSQRIYEGSHPDFLLIEPRIDEKTGTRKTEIIAEDARKMSEFLSLTPAEGDHRVCILDSADRLNISAANSILKILEEPPKRAIIILLSHGGHVLPTIKSRCVKIKLEPPSIEDLEDKMEQISGDLTFDEKALLINLSGGSIAMAKKIFDNDGLNVSRETLDIFSNFPNYDDNKNTSFAQNIAKSPELWPIFKHILSWLTIEIAKNTAKAKTLEIEGKYLNKNLSNFDAFLAAEQTANQDFKNTEIYNLDKKQTIIDILRRFSACYA